MANWASKEDVQERMGIGEARGYTDDNVLDRLERAQDDLRTKLQTIYSSDVIGAWDIEDEDSLPPSIITNMVADLAAAYLYAEIFHQSYEDDLSQACSFKRNVERQLKEIRSGEVQLVDSEGEEVGEASDTIFSTTSSKTPIFSAENPSDDTFGDGSLDEF
jgi:hypothetical protein